MDYSLDLIKLREVYEKVYRKRDFSFFNGKKEYTQRVINVTFKYNNKVFNRVRSGIYVRFGYQFENLVFKDCLCVEKGQLIAIKTDESVENPAPDKVLGDFFYLESGVYKAKENIKVLNSVNEIRTELYKNGFICDGIKYVRFKRSAGSSRVGKCLFIDEKLYKQMHQWEMCGINVKNGQKVDLAALESYISLTLSSIIDTIQLSAKNILVIDDFESRFTDTALAVELEDGKLVSRPKEVEICNSIWDGQSLLDYSMFGEYADKGMLLLRARFFKSCCFNTNIQQWFEDNGVTSVEQLNGHTEAKDIKDIKLITTPSSIKYLKFGTLKDWLWTLEPTFGVVKYEKPTPYFDGRLVQAHYQLLNTLQLSYDEVKELVSPSLEYIYKIKTDPSVLRYHIEYKEEPIYAESLLSKNDIIYKLLGINERFSETKLYYLFREDLIKSFMKNLRKGHILVKGNYSTLFGNPIEMLEMAIGKFNGESKIGVGNISCSNFKYGRTLLGSRSPHCTMGNVLLSKNKHFDIIDNYFNLTKEIVCVNSINQNTLECLSGAD